MDWNVKFYGAHEQQVPYGWSVPTEAHIGFEINLILEGSQETTIEHNRYELNAGDILLVPAGFHHVIRCTSREGMSYFCAHFNVDEPIFRQLMVKHGQAVYAKGSDGNAALRPVVDQWLDLLRAKTVFTTEDRFHIQMLLFELFRHLVRMVMQEKEQRQETLRPPSSLHYAKAIEEALKAGVKTLAAEEGEGGAAVRVEEIAASLGITQGYASEIFRKVYGLSPRQYLSELKLHEAKVLIQQPRISLGEAAARLGYAHLSHFSRQFKRWTGMSPLQYRRQSGHSYRP
jgi:AraC-like DNA-binding protein